MRSSLITICSLLLLLNSCQNIEGTEAENPATFIKVYEGPYGYTAASIEAAPEGFVILSNSADEAGNPLTIVFKVDMNGNRLSTPTKIEGGSATFIKRLPEGGYAIAGDSVYNQANPANVNDFQVVSTRIIILNENLQVQQKIVKTDDVNTNGKTDFKSTSIAVTDEGKIVVLGTYQQSDDTPVKPYVATFEKTGSVYEETWYKPIDLLDQDYQNARSVFYSEGNITWATAIANEQQNFNFSYVSIPTLQDGSVYVNNSLIGATTEQLYIPSDLYPFGFASGYGVIGTYGTTTKTNKNMFFVRTDESGNVVPGTEKFFDGISITTDKNASLIEDTGESIVATVDAGFVLGGTIQTIPGEVGAGGKDILLIKVNRTGEPVWRKTIGGSGDEVVRTVREFPDGSLIIFGTNTLGGFPSIFFIKTTSTGDL
jgi:hypothetical protein